MSNPTIGIVIGTVRENRFADKAVAWLGQQTQARADLDFEILDLKDYPLPFFNERRNPASGAEAENEVAKRWRQKLAALDGFIFMAAEYNHSPTAVLINALDWAYYEWNRKPVAFFGYGTMGASRAIEHLRLQIAELQMVSVRQTVLVGGADMRAIWDKAATLDDMPHLIPAAQAMLEDLSRWAWGLRILRQNWGQERRG